MRQLALIEISLGVIALGMLAVCIDNTVFVQNTVLGILAGATLGVALSSVWHVERMRRRVGREVREIEMRLGVGRN